MIFQCNMGGHAGDIEYDPSFTPLFHTLGYKLKEKIRVKVELCHVTNLLETETNCLVVNTHDPKVEHMCLHNP